jgi:hypothetical protein
MSCTYISRGTGAVYDANAAQTGQCSPLLGGFVAYATSVQTSTCSGVAIGMPVLFTTSHFASPGSGGASGFRTSVRSGTTAEEPDDVTVSSPHPARQVAVMRHTLIIVRGATCLDRMSRSYHADERSQGHTGVCAPVEIHALSASMPPCGTA